MNHEIILPINTIPLVVETDYSSVLRPFPHMDRTAPFNVLIYILRGRMEIIEDVVTHILVPGSLFFLKAGIHHWGEQPFEIGTAWYYVHFYSNMDESTVMDSISPYQFNPHEKRDLWTCPEDFSRYLTLPKHMVLPIGNELEHKLKELISYDKSDMPFKQNIMMCDILSCVTSIQTDAQTESTDNIRVQQVLNYLEKNYNRDINSQDIQNILGLSYKYIITIFRQKTGETIKSKLTDIRLRQAAKLLGESNLTVAEIADQCGYNDPLYFSKLFKKNQKMSPRAFRKHYRPKI